MRIGTVPRRPSTTRTTSGLSCLGGMQSTTRTVPSSVSNSVSRTSVPGRYRRRTARTCPAGATCHRPCLSSPSSAAKQAPESKRGRQSQSIEPSRPPGAAVWVSPSRGSSAPSPALGEDESYRLVVGEGGIVLGARTTSGALRGVETLLQLVRSGPEGWEMPACEVSDRPRFAWRGLLLDPARHFLPVAALRRTVEAMAAVKLNVLHLHLSDDQAFRLESRAVPELTAAGSDGRFFTQAELRELVALAADYGIRVVPELDVPGHTTSWLVGRPDLASGPGPHRLRARFGIARDALDPTNEAVYDVVDALLGELADLFPDTFVHVGGDEVRRETWLDNERIAGWMK